MASALIGCAAEERLQQEAEQAGGDQLRDHDEEVEDAHVDAHLPRRHAAGSSAYGSDRIDAQAKPTPTIEKQQPLRIADQQEATAAPDLPSTG